MEFFAGVDEVCDRLFEEQNCKMIALSTHASAKAKVPAPKLFACLDRNADWLLQAETHKILPIRCGLAQPVAKFVATQVPSGGQGAICDRRDQTPRNQSWTPRSQPWTPPRTPRKQSLTPQPRIHRTLESRSKTGSRFFTMIYRKRHWTFRVAFPHSIMA